MNEPDHRPARYRVGLFAIVVLGLLTLSCHGKLDDLARDHAEDARREAILVYGTVRALNVGVSVLQTSELGGVVGSVQIGQLLDPINDAAERASTALAWSIGSLFVQRILLDVASTSFVHWIFVAFGLLALLVCLPLMPTLGVSAAALDGVRRASVRWFAIVGILRFLVPAFVAGSHLASQALLQKRLNEDQEAVSEMSGPLEIVSVSDSINGEAAAEEVRNQIDGFLEDKADLEDQLAQVNEDFDKLSFFCRSVRLGCPPEADSLREERDRLNHEIDDIDRMIGEAERELECIEADGGPCASLWATFDTRVREAREMLVNLRGWASDLPERLTYLMISLLVKCIVFPILFLLVASKCGAYVVKQAAGLRLHVHAR